MVAIPYCRCLLPPRHPLAEEEGSGYTSVTLPAGTFVALRGCEECDGSGVNQQRLLELVSDLSIDSDTQAFLGQFLRNKTMSYYQVGLDKILTRTPEPKKPCYEDAVKAFRDFIVAVGEDPDRPGLVDTPARVARMYTNELCAGIDADLAGELTTTFAATYDEIVLLKDIEFWSMCEHHWIPFFGVAHIAYIPQGRIVGISKLARVVDLAAKKPNIQEELTQRIADAINDALLPLGVAVIIECEHLCMAMRGIRKPGAKTVTSVMLGAFLNNPPAREELMRLIYGRAG